MTIGPPAYGSARLIDLDTIDLDMAEPHRSAPRRQRWLPRVAGLLAVAAAVTTLAVGRVPPPVGVRAEADLLAWIASLVDAAPRGSSVADDTAFIRDLASRVGQLAGTSESPAFQGPPQPPGPDALVRVLFVDDVADRRVTLLAVQPAGIDDDSRYAVTRLLWLAAPRGASPQTLVGAVAGVEPAPGTQYLSTSVTPLTWADLGSPEQPVRIALAPPGCELSTTPSWDLDGWRLEPTGSYLIRTGTSENPEYWRVTCGGVIREDRPAPRGAVTDDTVEQVLASAVGNPARTTVEAELDLLFQTFGFELLRLPQVLWAGPVGETADSNATLLAAPAARGGWLGAAWVFLELEGGGAIAGQMAYFTTVADLADPDAVLGIPLGWGRSVLVIAPPSAATVRLVDRQGAVLDAATVTDRAMLLRLPSDAPAEAAVLVEAVGADGEPLSTSPLANTFVEPDRRTNWN